MKGFRSTICFTAIMSVAFLYSACGDSDSGSTPVVQPGIMELTADTQEDLPNCSKNRQGDLSYVTDENLVFLCFDGAWHYLGTVFENEDILPNCTEKHDGEKAFLIEDQTTVLCSDNRWSPFDVYKELEPEEEQESSSSQKIESSSSQKKEVSSSSSLKTVKSSSSKKIEVSSSSKKANYPATIEYGSLTDKRDGRTYKTVTIGTQTWMAEDLDYSDGHSNKGMYGRLYNREYSDLENLCPDGWHVPDSLEWRKMFLYVSDNNGGEPLGITLKATSGWIPEGEIKMVSGGGLESVDSTRIGASTGMDRFGFGALPSGSCWGSVCYTGDDARFTVRNASFGYKLALDKDNLLTDKDAVYGYISVRCIQNEVFLEEVSSSSAEELSSSSSFIESSSSNNESPSSSNAISQGLETMTDSRDGQTYKIVTIGSQTWMAENLNYPAEGSRCYNDDSVYCSKYGRLYRWAIAVDSIGLFSSGATGCGNGLECTVKYPVRGICPAGWHLPSKTEWETLISKIGTSSTAGKYLKSASGWDFGNGLDSFSFTALPAGYCDGKCGNVGSFTDFISSTEYSSSTFYRLALGGAYSNAYILSNNQKKTEISVRCLKD